jgi:hypothetical protein
VGEGVSRRRFVGWSGGATALALVEGNPVARAAGEFVVPRAATLTRTVRLVRAADQLDITVEIFDADVSGNTIKTRNSKAYVRVVFGPQHVAERHFGAGATVPTAQAAHMAAGDSVVVLKLAGTTTFSFDALLDIAESSAGIAGQSTAGVPAGDVSALEIPAGLLLSPVTGSRMRASRTPLTVNGVTEVWTARIERNQGRQPVELHAIRNLNSRDLVSRIPNASDRNRLVTNTTDGKKNRIKATRLWLSSSGANAHLSGDWPNSTLTKYRHRIITGRDLYVETVTAGYLLPFGLPASVVVVAEREFDGDGGGGTTAAMRTRRYLQIDDPTAVTNRAGVRNAARKLPFVQVTGSVDESVQIRVRDIVSGTVIPGTSTLEVADGGDPLLIDYRCIDRDGGTVTFSLPGVFIESDLAFSTLAFGPPARLVGWWNSPTQVGLRSVDLQGQSVAFADPEVPGARLTARPTFAVEFEMQGPAVGTTSTTMENGGSPAIFPAVRSATIVDTSVSALMGEPSSPVGVTFHPRYLTNGNTSANFDKVFLRMDTPAVAAVGGSSPARGVMGVDLRAEVLNQTAGIGLDLPNAPDIWNPADALGELSKIIGGISLQDIIENVEFLGAVPGVDIPGVKVEVTENTITTQVCFSPKISSKEDLGFIATADSKASVVVTGVVAVDGSSEPSFSTEISIRDFTMRFLPGSQNPLVDVHFTKVSALISSSSGIDINTDVDGVTLYGALSYLSSLLGSAGFANPRLQVTGDHLDVGVTVKLPNISLGVLTVKNISVDFGLLIPLQDAPGELSIDVGTKRDPVTLAVLSFGGTFYFGLDMRFGANAEPGSDTIVVGVSIFWEILKIDVIVAKATVTLRLAANWELEGENVTFVGTASVEGVISIGGFIEVSVTAQLKLVYKSTQEKLVLTGTLFWAVDTPLGGKDGDVPLGSTTIDLSDSGARGLRPSGPGERMAMAALAGGDVSFGSIHTSTTWTQYCDAFA